MESNGGQKLAAESQRGVKDGTQANPNTGLGGKSVETDLHGDWLTVNRTKRQQKSRNKNNQNSMESQKGGTTQDNNKFAAFKEGENNLSSGG
ncbi:hypothetical protein SESBI_41775 [Sesbania bispinosa]|nr:hypothetical protein SESBI_41775 [Sesbania bispinosa]